MGESELLRFPPGFRFHPSDEELIVHYLQRKVTSRPFPESIIAEIDLYKYNPWELPNKASFGEKEWYFFTPRERKYPNGKRPNRAAGLGYWKATGIDKPIYGSLGLSNKPIGVKKGLVFYSGRAPRGHKTDWSMNEYRLLDSPKLNGLMRLDDWVLCRIRCRLSSPKSTHKVQDNSHSTAEILRSEAPKPEQTIDPMSANRDIIADYIHKDCVYLAWLFSGGQLVPPMGIRNGYGLTGSNINNETRSQILFSTDDSFNLLNGETSEQNDNLTSQNIAETNMYSNTENQFQFGDQMDSTIKFQEVNEQWP